MDYGNLASAVKSLEEMSMTAESIRKGEHPEVDMYSLDSFLHSFLRYTESLYSYLRIISALGERDNLYTRRTEIERYLIAYEIVEKYFGPLIRDLVWETF